MDIKKGSLDSHITLVMGQSIDGAQAALAKHGTRITLGNTPDARNTSRLWTEEAWGRLQMGDSFRAAVHKNCALVCDSGGRSKGTTAPKNDGVVGERRQPAF